MVVVNENGPEELHGKTGEVLGYIPRGEEKRGYQGPFYLVGLVGEGRSWMNRLLYSNELDPEKDEADGQ